MLNFHYSFFPFFIDQIMSLAGCYSDYKNIKIVIRGGSRTAATSKMERFVIIVNGFQDYHKALHLGCCSSPRSASGNNDNLHQLDQKRKQLIICTTFRSSRSQMFFKIGVLKNFAIFTEKHLCWSLFLIKLQASRPKRLRQRCFPVDIAKFLRTDFVIDHLRCLILNILLDSYILTESLFYSAARFTAVLRTLLRINDGVSLRI